MQNPLRSEAEAYRLLGVVIVGAAVIIGAAFINTWLGVAVAVIAFAALTRGVVSTFEPLSSSWLRKDLIERLRKETGLPVEHVTVAKTETEVPA